MRYLKLALIIGLLVSQGSFAQTKKKHKIKHKATATKPVIKSFPAPPPPANPVTGTPKTKAQPDPAPRPPML
jgi:hypothetical protein